jgi:hypothetical protein
VTAPLADILDEMAAMIEGAAQAAAAGDYGELQVSGRRNFNPTPPSIDMWPGDPFRAEPDPFTGFQEVQGSLLFTVRARVTTVDNGAGQELLLRLMDEEDDIGIAFALMDDQSLNGLAGSVNVEANTGYIAYLEGDEPRPLLGCEWRVRVIRRYS